MTGSSRYRSLFLKTCCADKHRQEKKARRDGDKADEAEQMATCHSRPVSAQKFVVQLSDFCNFLGNSFGLDSCVMARTPYGEHRFVGDGPYSATPPHRSERLVG